VLGVLGRFGILGFWIGICWLCKLFRKSEVVLEGDISEIRNDVGIGFGFSDLGLGCGKLCGKMRDGVGFYWGLGLWESIY
jgi:hypothetical protein